MYKKTLVNAGLYLNEQKVYSFYETEEFPKYSYNCFNYGEICPEFYYNRDYCMYLKVIKFRFQYESDTTFIISYS